MAIPSTEQGPISIPRWSRVSLRRTRYSTRPSDHNSASRHSHERVGRREGPVHRAFISHMLSVVHTLGAAPRRESLRGGFFYPMTIWHLAGARRSRSDASQPAERNLDSTECDGRRLVHHPLVLAEEGQSYLHADKKALSYGSIFAYLCEATYQR